MQVMDDPINYLLRHVVVLEEFAPVNEVLVGR